MGVVQDATLAIAALQGQPSVAAERGTIFRSWLDAAAHFGDRICASGVWWGVWERLWDGSPCRPCLLVSYGPLALCQLGSPVRRSLRASADVSTQIVVKRD